MVDRRDQSKGTIYISHDPYQAIQNKDWSFYDICAALVTQRCLYLEISQFSVDDNDRQTGQSLYSLHMCTE